MTTWRKPAGCSGINECLEVAPCDTGHCIEVGTFDSGSFRYGLIGLRTPTSPGASIVATVAEFAAFIAAAKAGQYDDLCEEKS